MSDHIFIYLGIWKNHCFVFFPNLCWCVYFKPTRLFNTCIMAVSDFLNAKVRVSTSDFCQCVQVQASSSTLRIYTFDPRKPLYARSGVFALHYYYTWKYQKLNVTLCTKHCTAARLHTVHRIFLNAWSNYSRSLCILQMDLKYHTIHRCLLGGKGEICV